MELTNCGIDIISKKTKGCCAICGTPYNLEIHHLIPKGSIQGGNDNIENLIFLCSNCHTQGENAVHRNRAELIKLQERFITDLSMCLLTKEQRRAKKAQNKGKCKVGNSKLSKSKKQSKNKWEINKK